MKSTRGILAGLLLFGSAATIEAQNQAVPQESAAPRPAVAFPPTPTPVPKEEPMTSEQLDEHVVPSQFLQRTSDVLTLVYNGFRRSQVDPCGCVSHQLGGLAKEAQIIKRIRDIELPILQVDAGGYVRDTPDQKLLIQTKYLIKGLGKIGYEVLNVGFTDTVIPPAELKSLASEAGLKVVSANITNGAGELLFDPYVITEVQQTNKQPLKIGIIGVTRPRHEIAPGAVTDEAQAPSSEGIVITSSVDAINKYASELKDKVDFVVVLNYDRRSNADTTIKAIQDKPSVNVMVMGENSQIQGNVQVMDGIQVVSGGYEGRQVGTLYMELKENKVISTWNKHLEVVQTIPSVQDIDELIKEAHSNTKATDPGSTSSDQESTAPAKLKLNL